MPAARRDALFEYKGQWISTEAGSANLQRYWTEPGTGRTRRKSLGTANLEDAKIVFIAQIEQEEPKTVKTPLAAVLLDYCVKVTDHLASKDNARLACRTLLAFFGNDALCEDITEQRQQDFAEASALKGHSLGYISRNLSVMSAAFRKAKLSIKVMFSKETIKAEWKLKTKPKWTAFVPSDEELVRLLDAEGLPEQTFRWLVMDCLLFARPEAILDLAPQARNRDNGCINLLPKDREQNKKHRPILPEPQSLTAWLDHWGAWQEWDENRKEMIQRYLRPDEHYCLYASVDALQSSIHRWRVKVGLPAFSPYSVRHKGATVLRSRKVPKDERKMWLGHMQPEDAVSDGYGEWDPDYLRDAASAINAWWLGLQHRMTRRSLLPANSRPTLGQNKMKLRAVA